jgi:hypothetical protein
VTSAAGGPRAAATSAVSAPASNAPASNAAGAVARGGPAVGKRRRRVALPSRTRSRSAMPS